ncbi:MAG: hypothetical protein AAFQ43_11830 [Bacteroidota bacterium]
MRGLWRQTHDHARPLATGMSPLEAGDEGFTLVETVVATVLIVVALLPLAAAVVFATARPEARLQAEALVRAQDALETALATDSEDWRSESREDGLWRVSSVAGRDGSLARVVVHVQRGASPDTLATLEAARLVVPPAKVPEWAER